MFPGVRIKPPLLADYVALTDLDVHGTGQSSREGPYDMETDRTEMHDLAAQHPERVRDMNEQYQAWAKRCGVIPREKILELMKAEGGTAFWEEEKQK